MLKANENGFYSRTNASCNDFTVSLGFTSLIFHKDNSKVVVNIKSPKVTMEKI